MAAFDANSEEAELNRTNAGFDAGKEIEAFRVYEGGYDREDTVVQHYTGMRRNQTVDFVRRMQCKYMKFDNAELTIREAFQALEGYVDSSDPDTELPNLEHMLQTAEAIRAAGHPDWFQLVGLLHDMGKIMFLWGEEKDGQVGTAEGPQWALGGDTWVVGCRLPDCMTLPHLNALNPDMSDPRYNTELGMYEEGCGLGNLEFAWGHDEYLYQMLRFNGCLIPEEGLAMIRYHSCYPWHQGGAYERLLKPEDAETKRWVKLFNQFDLYTKADARPDVEALFPYYQGLIDRYCPGKLRW